MINSQIIKAPSTDASNKPLSVFLCGSIENNRASLWQNLVERKLSAFEITIYNPRRDDYNINWEQSKDNPNFKEQVNWELDKLEQSDFIFVYLEPETKSPITLLEFGKFSESDKSIVVVCPDGFWRKGNIEVMCERYNLQLFESLDEGIDYLKFLLKDSLDGFTSFKY